MVKTPKGQPSTNEEALEAIADQHELPRVILDYRGLAKLRSTYTDKLPEMVNPDTGRVHTSYHQSGAATGRLSSSDPNLQNIPIRTEDGRRIRRAFIAPEGCQLLAADYSQIELRIMAHLSEDPGLVRAFEQGADVHRATAAEVFGRTLEEVTPNERRAAKAINFGLMYGMSAFGLARNLGIDRGRRRTTWRCTSTATRACATSWSGCASRPATRLCGNPVRPPPVPERHPRPQPGLRAGAERAAINAPMQGTAADIIKRAMVDVDQWLRDSGAPARMILQVHDELVFETESSFVEDLRLQVVERMSQAAKLRVPLVVDTGVGSNWDEAH